MKRFLSWLLCLTLMLGMLPAVAAQSESDSYTVMAPKSAQIAASDTSTKGVWYNNSTTFSDAAGAANYFEIVEEGFAEAGAFHVYQDNVTNADMSAGIFLGGQPAGTYTVKLQVKGDLGHLGQTCKFYPYGCDGLVANLHNALNNTIVDDWTEVSYTVEVPNEFYYLIFSFSKYNWKTDFYVDNIRLLNSSGVDVLQGAGNFCTYEEKTCSSAETKQYPDALDTSLLSSSGQADQWVPFSPYGAYQSTWPAWDDTRYGEIVADGFRDAGSLHLVSSASHNTGVVINPGMTVGQTYTLGLWVKGSSANANKVLSQYGNGDGTIVGNAQYSADGITGSATVSSQWQYVERSFTALKTSLALFAVDWGVNDLYIDNITLKNAQGEDLLAGYGDFYTQPEEPAELLTIDTSKVAEAYTGYAGQWTPFSHYPVDQGSWQGTWPAWDDTHYGEIVQEGKLDPGALHLVSAASKNAAVAIDAGMRSGESYTLGLWVKGSAASNKMLALYGNGSGTIIGNPTYCADAVLSSVPASWTYVEKTFTADRSLLILVAADWGSSDLYIDNITLKNADGVDLLSGYGDFYVKPVELLPLDTEKMFSAYNAPNGVWSVMYPAGAPNDSTWPAWDDTHYGEIVKNGYKDPGALHLVSASHKNAAVAIGVDMTAGEEYTLGLWAKGSSNSGKVLFSYANGDPVIIGASALKAEWTYYEVAFTCSTTQLNIVAADWGETDIYIDNITLKNVRGEDLLAGYGDFCVKEAEDEPEGPIYQDPTEEGWIGRDAYDQLELGVDYDYSFAVLGDIQHITDWTPTDLHYLFDYILDNKDAKNIQFVFGMGDTTNDNHNEANNLVEWKLAQQQFFRFNGVLPYTVIRGNHDVVSRMNAYFADPNKPGYTDQLDGFYQAGSVVNVWKEFSVAGVDYLSLLIDYESSDSVLEWAADVIKAHPNHRVIVGTHVYLQLDGSYDNEMNPSGSEPGSVNNAQQVWDKLISQHENIFMVMSGHESSDNVAIQHKYGVHGNQITEIRVDSQYTDLVYMNKDGDVRGGAENGVGMVTLLYFKNDGTQVAVEHYSTLRGWYRQLQTFEIEPYAHYGWRYADSHNVDLYKPSTSLTDAPAIWQNGLGSYGYQDFVTENDLSYAGAGAAILPDHNMNLGAHTYALHSGSRTVEPSQTYTISYKIKGLSNAGRTWTQIHFCRSAMGGSDTWESQWGEGRLIQGPVADWQTVSYDVTMDEKTSAIEIYFIVNGSQLLIDDFSIVKKGETENIVTNGDFEQGTDGAYPTGFYAMKTGGLGTVEKVSGVGIDGSAAVRVEPRPGYILKTENALSAAAEETYTLSYMVRVPGQRTDITPVIRLYNGSGAATELAGTAITEKTEWQKVSYTFTTLADTVSIQPCLLAYGGRVDIDNLSLKNAQGQELLANGSFAQGLSGFAGEFVQGLSQGTIQSVHSARPDSLILNAKAEDGVLNVYEGETCIGTADWLYGQLARKVNFGLYVADADTAAAAAQWSADRQIENLWVIASCAALVDTVLAANSNIRVVLDCRADSLAAGQSPVPNVLLGDAGSVDQLKQDGFYVIVAGDDVSGLLESGADAILTTDSLAAISTLESVAGLPVAPAADVVQWNLTLGGNIGVNFHIQAQDPENTNVTVTVDGVTTQAVLSADNKAGAYYVVCANVAAAQMTQPILLQIYVGGQLVQSRSYTVRQYAEHILSGSYDDDTKALVKEMLNYGTAAQLHFGCNTDRLAGDGVAMGSTGSVQIPQTAQGALDVTGTPVGVRCYGASLSYRSGTAVRIYFAGDATGCSFTVNGKAVTAKEKDGLYYVELADIGPDRLAEAVTVTVTAGGTTQTVTYSPMDYMVRMSAKGSDTLKALLQALYNYHLAAANY